MNLKSVKKVLSIIGNVFLWLFVAFSILITVLVFSTMNNKDSLPNIFGTSLVTIQTDSMKPTMNPGDLIFDKILTEDEKKELEVGDIITFYVDLNNDGIKELNTHTIIGKYEEGGYIYYNTQGDNVDREDRAPVMHPFVLAKYTGFRIGGVGKAVDFLQSQLGFLLVIVIPLVLFFLFALYRFIATIVRMNSKGKISKDQEEEIKRRAIEEYLRQQQEQAPRTQEENKDGSEE